MIYNIYIYRYRYKYRYRYRKRYSRNTIFAITTIYLPLFFGCFLEAFALCRDYSPPVGYIPTMINPILDLHYGKYSLFLSFICISFWLIL